MDSQWILDYSGFQKDEEGLREALSSIGNGYFGTRGAAPWLKTDEDAHYPGTYLAGGYNRLPTPIGGRPIMNEDLVNMPNWLFLTFSIEGGTWFNIDDVEVVKYRHALNLREGVLTHTIEFRDKKKRETRVEYRRFASMAQEHVAAIALAITPLNWSGSIRVHSELDGTVANRGVARYRQLAGQHLEPLESGSVATNVIHVSVRTTQSHIVVAEAARTQCLLEGVLQEVECANATALGTPFTEFAFEAKEGKTHCIEKIVGFYTSRDVAVTEPVMEANDMVQAAPGFDDLLQAHIAAWARLWARCDVQILGDAATQLNARLHIFQVLQVACHNTVEHDVSVPARGWTGEAYRGHIFWDELYIYPFLNFNVPEVVRSLLKYRHRRIEPARQAAKAEGYNGAMYPWQSGSNGVEETQITHLNPKSGKWDPDLSHHQRHVNIAIAFCIWQYYQMTDDLSALEDFGAEVIIEIARFWVSISHFNAERGRYEIHGVMGPDEYHEKYPGAPDTEPGVKNNAYTNVMVAWVLGTAERVLGLLPAHRSEDLINQLAITTEERAHWKEMTTKMFVPFTEEGIIAQFEGYNDLQEFDWEGYRKKYDNIQRLDRILKAEGDSPDKYKLCKQADTLMLLYVLPEPELQRIFDSLGYPFDKTTIKKNIDYHMARTCNGSTLSFLVNSAILSRYRYSTAYKMFLTALRSDISDVQGGTTKEGIHLGTMSGTVDIIQRWMTGMEIREGVPHFFPNAPKELGQISFNILCRGVWYDIKFDASTFTITPKKIAHPVRVGFFGEEFMLDPNVPRAFVIPE